MACGPVPAKPCPRQGSSTARHTAIGDDVVVFTARCLSLLRLEARLFDDVAIALPAITDRLPEGCGRTRDRLHPELGHGFLHLGRFNCGTDSSIGTDNDFRRR